MWITVLSGATFNAVVAICVVSLLLFRLPMAMLWQQTTRQKEKYQNTQSLCWFCRNVFSFITKPLTLAILTYYFMQFIDSIWYLVKPNHVWKCKVEVGCFWHPCLDILFMGVQWNEMKLTQNGTKFFLKEYFYPFFFRPPFSQKCPSIPSLQFFLKQCPMILC